MTKSRKRILRLIKIFSECFATLFSYSSTQILSSVVSLKYVSKTSANLNYAVITKQFMPSLQWDWSILVCQVNKTLVIFLINMFSERESSIVLCKKLTKFCKGLLLKICYYPFVMYLRNSNNHLSWELGCVT